MKVWGSIRLEQNKHKYLNLNESLFAYGIFEGLGKIKEKWSLCCSNKLELLNVHISFLFHKHKFTMFVPLSYKFYPITDGGWF